MQILLTIFLILSAVFLLGLALVLFSPLILRVRGGKEVPFTVEGSVLHPAFLRLRHGVGTEEPCLEILHRWRIPLGEGAGSGAGAGDSAGPSYASPRADAAGSPVNRSAAAPGPRAAYHHPDAGSRPAAPGEEGAAYRRDTASGSGTVAGDEAGDSGGEAASLGSRYARLRALRANLDRWYTFLSRHTTLYTRLLRWILRVLGSFLRIIRLDAAEVRVRAGLGDVFHTGLLCAALAPFLGRNSAAIGLEFVPDFGESLVLEGSGDVTLRTSIAMMLGPLVTALLFFPYWRVGVFYWHWRRFRRVAG